MFQCHRASLIQSRPFRTISLRSILISCCYRHLEILDFLLVCQNKVLCEFVICPFYATCYAHLSLHDYIMVKCKILIVDLVLYPRKLSGRIKIF
jgi:hypothetical protein